jgi:uncharacterized membrane protein
MADPGRVTRFAKRIQMVAGLTGLLLAISAVTLVAQTSKPPRAYYDISKEVTLTGKVLIVFRVPSQGMIPGSHILLATSSGQVDASLGRWGLQGSGALSAAPGQVIEVTGVMKTLLDKPVFVVRTAKAGDQTYQMRNEFGIPVSPQARERALQNAAQKEESQ